MPGLTWKADVCIGVPRHLPRPLCRPWTVHKPLSFELACRRKTLSNVKGDYQVSRVVALTSIRVASLSSPQAWTTIVWVVVIKLSREDMLLVLQVKSDVSGEWSPCI